MPLIKLLGLSALFFCLTAGQVFAQKNVKNTRDEAALQAQLQQKADALREISNAFAGHQAKVAYLKRDRAMLEHDAGDSMLPENQRRKLQEKIAGIDSQMAALEPEKIENRAHFASAAKDYEDFMKENFSPPDEEKH